MVFVAHVFGVTALGIVVVGKGKEDKGSRSTGGKILTARGGNVVSYLNVTMLTWRRSYASESDRSRIQIILGTGKLIQKFNSKSLCSTFRVSVLFEIQVKVREYRISYLE
jgi:hypothetical protein